MFSNRENKSKLESESRNDQKIKFIIDLIDILWFDLTIDMYCTTDYYNNDSATDFFRSQGMDNEIIYFIGSNFYLKWIERH